MKTDKHRYWWGRLRSTRQQRGRLAAAVRLKPRHQLRTQESGGRADDLEHVDVVGRHAELGRVEYVLKTLASRCK